MRVRFYRGQFRPGIDTPVKDNLALSIQDFGLLPLNRQQDILASNATGDPGTPNPDIDYLAPYMIKGITFAELMKLYQQSKLNCKQGFDRKSASEILAENYSKLFQTETVTNEK